MNNFRFDCKYNNKYFCEILDVMDKRKLEDQAMQILHDLNEQYGNIKFHVPLDHFPLISKICSFIV